MQGEWRLVRYRGVWCAYRREGDKPVRRSLGTPDRALADTRFAAFLHDERRQERPRSLTVGSIIDAYIESLHPGSHARTRQEMTRRALRKVSAPNLLATRPEHLTRDMCRDYAAARFRAGKKPGTVIADLGLVRTALNWAVKEGWLPAAPYVELPEKPEARDRWLTPEEAAKLIEAAGAPHVRLFIVLALHTAARAAALLDLTWAQVNDRFIDLNPPGRVRTTKGRAVVPMNPVLAAELEAARTIATTDYVIEWAGRPVQAIKKGFERATERAALLDVTPHTLRHTAATWMVQAGVPIPKVAAYLGHSDSRTTERVYGHHAPDFLRDASSAIVERLRVCAPGSNEPVDREQNAHQFRKQHASFRKTR